MDKKLIDWKEMRLGSFSFQFWSLLILSVITLFMGEYWTFVVMMIFTIIAYWIDKGRE